MRDFDYTERLNSLFTPKIVRLLVDIREYRGKQDLYIEADADVLHSLLQVAKIQSTQSSNRIEGIFTTDKRLAELMNEKSEPINRSEQEIVGYRDTLQLIHESYEYIPITSNYILQLHKNLYSFSNASVGGHFKNQDNIIAQT